MVFAAGPNWLGSPQHFFGGLALALAVVVFARLIGLGTPLACLLAVGLTSAAEIVVELLEYPLKHAGTLHATAYYDTLADLGNTLVGALVAIAIAAIVIRRRNRRRQRLPAPSGIRS
jgi:ABC-type spermidine/putrescine transport system permease subunit II